MDTEVKFVTYFPQKMEQVFGLGSGSLWPSLRNHPRYALPIGKCNCFSGQTFDMIRLGKYVKQAQYVT